MELKEYQQKVLENLEIFLKQMKNEFAEKRDYYEFQISKNKEAVDPEKSDYPQLAWARCKEKIVIKSDYSTRFDGLNRNIPNACFKVPTGGGKTLLAAHALRQINQDYFEQNNGFILWVVPSQTIYKQTLKHLCNREHPYRQVLDQASGGRVKILEKNDAFKPQDVADNLCVMLLMLQSSNRETKESLRFFRDSGKFREFFPEVDDYIKNKNLLDEVQNLETADLFENFSGVVAGLSIKHSLGNVLRLIRPIVLIDEGHRAMSQLAEETINGFNPKFILELSATPKNKSNVLIDVKGVSLKDEQMIKLPINLQAYPNSDWKSTLNQANQKLLQLSKDAALLENKDGRYIRPIMVVKAESKKKNTDFDQVTEIKSYLMNNLAVREDEIRIKLSENDEIGDEDLLGRICQVKYIITKDALKEGWDCSFAYVLAILSNTKSDTALTQFIGRVLRQPDAKTTSSQSLNECYVYCTSSDVDQAAAGVKKGLEEEGMGDLQDQIKTGNEAEGNGVKKVKLQRREKYREEKILLPTLNAVDKNGLRSFDYYRDILSEINWADYKFSAKILLNDDKEKSFIYRQIDVDEDGQTQMNLSQKVKYESESDDKIDRSLIVSQLIEKINNPWQAARIIDEVLIDLSKSYDEKQISFNSVFIVEQVKKDAFKWFLEKSESVFKNKLNSKEIFMRLVAFESNKFNWKMPSEVEINVGINEAPITSFDKNIFEPQFASILNGFERKIASYINDREAVKWWHRLAVRGSEYAVSGWTKEKLYPDFLIAYSNESGKVKMQFVEAKGEHLKGNDKTNYINSLFEVLNSHLNENFESVGEVKLFNKKDEIAFDLVLQENQESDLIRIEKSATT